MHVFLKIPFYACFLLFVLQYFNIGEALKHLELAQFEEDVYSTADSGLSQDEQDFLSFIFSVGKNSSDIRDETDFSTCTNN